MITILSQYVTKISNLLRSQCLYISLRNVKTYSVIFITPLCAICNSNNLANQSPLLTIGEHVEISMENVVYYNIGNKEVLAASPINKNKVIILKALSKGTCEVLLKFKNNRTTIHKFTVVTKAKRRKISKLTEIIKSFGLSVLKKSELLYVSGEIFELNHLQHYLKIEGSNEEIQRGQIKISKKNKNQHIAKIYQYFWMDGIKNVSCHYQNLKYICYYHSDDLSVSLKKLLENYHFLKLVKLENKLPSKECIEIRVWDYSVDNNSPNKLIENGLNVDLNSPHHFLNKPISVFLGQSTGEAKLLSSEKIYLSPGKKAYFSSGIKIPILNINNTGSTVTKFKFIGLSASLGLRKKGQSFELDIENKISSPTENGAINHAQFKTSINLEKFEELIFFKHQLSQQTRIKDSVIPIPLLRDVDLLKINGNRKTNKSLIGTIQLGKNCE